jgi:AcrR family transcriptional regulator
MEDEPRRLRADAERNRRRLLDAATEMFCERGLEVSVGEIAERAGVGRATLFRNFASKEELIVAIVVQRTHESVSRGQALMEADDPGQALFSLIDQSVGHIESDRALFDVLDDTWMANDEIRAAHAELLAVLDALVSRAQQAGVVREDVSAVDVLMMVKGVCEASRSFRHVDPDISLRQLDLVRAAISAPDHQRPLRGRRPSLDELDPGGARVPSAADAGSSARSSPRSLRPSRGLEDEIPPAQSSVL